MSNKCFAGIRKVTSHSERNSIILASSLGRMFWVALNAGSRSGTCAVVGTPTVPLAYSSAKKKPAHFGDPLARLFHIVWTPPKGRIQTLFLKTKILVQPKLATCVSYKLSRLDNVSL